MKKKTFNPEDFMSNDIPGCPLTSNLQVAQGLQKNLQEGAEILDVFLTAFLYKKQLLHEWHALVNVRGKQTLVRLPAYLPENKMDEKALLRKHAEIQKIDNLQQKIYFEGDYLLLGSQPCYLTRHKNILYVKRIMKWASQKMVQDFLSTVMGYENVVAQFGIIQMHSINSKYLKDIGWQVETKKGTMVLPLEHFQATSLLTECDGFSPLVVGSRFTLNGQRYVLDQNEKDGQFIIPKP